MTTDDTKVINNIHYELPSATSGKRVTEGIATTPVTTTESFVVWANILNPILARFCEPGVETVKFLPLNYYT